MKSTDHLLPGLQLYDYLTSIDLNLVAHRLQRRLIPRFPPQRFVSLIYNPRGAQTLCLSDSLHTIEVRWIKETGIYHRLTSHLLAAAEEPYIIEMFYPIIASGKTIAGGALVRVPYLRYAV
jgi:hypothetical protein